MSLQIYATPYIYIILIKLRIVEMAWFPYDLMWLHLDRNWYLCHSDIWIRSLTFSSHVKPASTNVIWWLKHATIWCTKAGARMQCNPRQIASKTNVFLGWYYASDSLAFQWFTSEWYQNHVEICVYTSFTDEISSNNLISLNKYCDYHEI